MRCQPQRRANLSRSRPSKLSASINCFGSRCHSFSAAHYLLTFYSRIYFLIICTTQHIDSPIHSLASWPHRKPRSRSFHTFDTIIYIDPVTPSLAARWQALRFPIDIGVQNLIRSRPDLGYKRKYKWEVKEEGERVDKIRRRLALAKYFFFHMYTFRRHVDEDMLSRFGVRRYGNLIDLWVYCGVVRYPCFLVYSLVWDGWKAGGTIQGLAMDC